MKASGALGRSLSAQGHFLTTAGTAIAPRHKPRKAEPGIMNRPPRSRHERALQPALLARAYIFLGGFEAITAMAAFFFVWPRLGYVPVTTACLAAIVITQLVNVQLCRSGRESLFTSIRQWNTLLVAGMGIEMVLILVIVYTPVGNLVFGRARSEAMPDCSCCRSPPRW